jgi:hypothetical protein
MATSQKFDVHSNQLLGAMEPANRKRIEPHLEPIKRKLGDIVCEAGGLLKHAYFPQGTVLSLLTVLEDGSAIETANIGRSACWRWASPRRGPRIHRAIRPHHNELPEAADPFRAEDRLPDCCRRDRQHDRGAQQRDREQEPVLFQIPLMCRSSMMRTASKTVLSGATEITGEVMMSLTFMAMLHSR